MTKYFQSLIGLFVLISISHQLNAQRPDGNNPNVSTAPSIGIIKGKVVDAATKAPLEYSSIALFSSTDSTLLGGSIANAEGKFEIAELKPGKYYIEAKFIGFYSKVISNLSINRNSIIIDAGTIELKPASNNIDEVVVTASNKAITYQLDKKVIDPSKFPTAAGGTAIDILSNTPSVSVDIEGNVTMRGSGNFKVLVDGKPTMFESSDALQKIPTSIIQNIEIITNPSAKFDPDGTAGIINVITKKSKISGMSGIINATADSYGSLTGDLLLNYRFNKFNFFVGGNRSSRMMLSETTTENMAIDGDTITTHSFGDTHMNFYSYSLKGGFDYYINNKNTLTFNVDANGRKFERGGTLAYHETRSTGYDLRSTTNSNTMRDGDNIALSLDYKKSFKAEGHEITGSLLYEKGGDITTSFSEQYVLVDSLINGQKSWESGDDKEYRVKVDYIYPSKTFGKFEAGFQSRIDRNADWKDNFTYSTLADYTPNSNSANYHTLNFNNDIHSLYGIFSKEFKSIGCQLGLRSEYSDRTVTYTANPTPYKLTRFDWFPTVHLSFKLPAEQQFALSYTRRIDRPRGFYLNPYITYLDQYNVRQGNPLLEAEYIDSYEFGYQYQFKKGFFSAEGYLRQNKNVIERIKSVYSGNIMMNTVANVGTSTSYGIESMMNYTPLKWWTLNAMINIYHYKLNGGIGSNKIETESNNWTGRINNSISIFQNTKMQFDYMYISPTVTAQGRREGFSFANIAIRQDFFKKQFSATFTVRDVLNTSKFVFTTSGPNFSGYTNMDMISPVYAITLSYRINNFKQQKKPGADGGQGNGMGNGMEGEF